MQDEDEDPLQCVEDGEDPGKHDGGLAHDEETKQPRHPQQRQQDKRRLDDRPVTKTELTELTQLTRVIFLNPHFLT